VRSADPAPDGVKGGALFFWAGAHA